TRPSYASPTASRATSDVEIRMRRVVSSWVAATKAWRRWSRWVSRCSARVTVIAIGSLPVVGCRLYFRLGARFAFRFVGRFRVVRVLLERDAAERAEVDAKR